MIEINWNNFKAKFNDKEQKSFERLCYLMFCDEFDQKIGVFRYKNQVGIETEPIQTKTDCVGFQAKFFDTKIDDNKADIIDSIKKAKDKNPKLTKIYFYLNKEFSESSKKNIKEPKYKIKIENEAKNINLRIDWRVPSHFEKQLALPKNNYLAEYFFSSGKTAIDFLNDIKEHTENILHSIHYNIKFNDKIIKMDRTKLIEKIEEDFEKSEIVIINGESGSGKTALIKEFYEKANGKTPFYIFKAAEFNISYIGDIFNKLGKFSLNDFIEMHKCEDMKYIVVDSAEKLLDLENQDAFKEFLSALIKKSWKIIFTTRYNYLDDLIFQFVEVYRLPFQEIKIKNLSDKELIALSKKYDFQLSPDQRLQSLIQNLFYLNEYLQNLQDFDNEINYKEFKRIIWQKKIQKSTEQKENLHIERETCFLELAKARCESGLFFIMSEQWSKKALSKLEADEIIKYDSNQGGYFITHDIYEEWALEKIIERDFNASKNYSDFFKQVGISLPIRRAFRNWLSDKIIDNIDDIKPFIENVFLDKKVKSFWKDELLISILLSNYSANFFNQFEKIILEQNHTILERIVFLLKTACKEIDKDISTFLSISNKDIDQQYIFTKPKGSGWNSTIDFIFKHIEKSNPTNINYIIPLLIDWNINNKIGNTTRKASLLALHFYKEIQFNEKYRYNSINKKNLIKIFLQGTPEIKKELKAIFEEVIKNRWAKHGDPYFELCETILTSPDDIDVIMLMPEYVIKLAELFWLKTKIKKTYPFEEFEGPGVEKYYSLNINSNHDYYPASAFQTPIYLLLHVSLKNTIDFILNFTNKTVQEYVNSYSDKTVEEIEITINSQTKIKQFICQALWNMYRGNNSPVLLSSIHMALEKYLLNSSKDKDEKTIEDWLIYLLKNSKSASITSVVTSVVLAYPDKFFNVAKILFNTSEFFQFDNIRQFYENQIKSSNSIGYGLNYKNKSFEEERIKSCEAPHRKTSLESLALSYQLFKKENISEKVFKYRQKTIWDIIDRHNDKLCGTLNEDDNETKLKLLLLKIDKRKLNPTVVRRNNNVSVKFNPEIDPKLKNICEDAKDDYLEKMKYVPLQLWSTHKFNNDKRYEEYEQYENNPHLVLKETMEIVEGLKNTQDVRFQLANGNIPAFTCSVLIKEYENKLSKKEKEYCKHIIVDYTSRPLQPNYQYQAFDGVEVAVNALPFFFNLFPEEIEYFKTLFSLILFDNSQLGFYKRVCDYAIETIVNNLWDISFEDAQDVFLGFLMLKPKFDLFEDEFLKESYTNYKDGISRGHVLEKFIEKFNAELENIFSSKILYEDIEISDLNIEILETAFQLLPSNTSNTIHFDFISNILPILSERLVDNDKVDYSFNYRFFEKFSYFILNRKPQDIRKLLQPLIDNFSYTKEMSSFLKQILIAEDKLKKYEQFWLIWECFYDRIVDMCNNHSSNVYLSEIVHNYLLAWSFWQETAKEWHSLKDREKVFYKKVAEDIGHCPAVLDSISKLLNEIGSGFLNDGIFWISVMIEKNSKLATGKLEINTIYYIETLARKYIYLNSRKVKEDLKIRNKILIILNFLFERGSVKGNLLRESII